MSENVREGRKKIRISIIDFLIVLTVVACVCGIFVHYKLFENNNKVLTDDVCNISVMLYGVDNDISEKIVSGNKVYLKDGNEEFGVVSDVSKEDAVVYYSDSQNEIATGTDNTKKDIKLTVEVKGDLSESGFYANGKKYIASGMEIDIFSAEFSAKGLIFGVESRSE